MSLLHTPTSISGFLKGSLVFQSRALVMTVIRIRSKYSMENETTIVIVEGVHYGFGVAVWLISRDPSLMRFRRYDLRDLLSIRCPGYVPPVAKPTDTTNIQKRRIREYAPALKAYARDVRNRSRAREGDRPIFTGKRQSGAAL